MNKGNGGHVFIRNIKVEDLEGTHKGIALTPLYHCVPKSVVKYPDSYFYDLLSLLDALRSGRARERNIAAYKISKMLSK